MRGPFIAVAGPPRAMDGMLAANGWPDSFPAGWQKLAAWPGLILFGPEATPLLATPETAIVGRLFARNDAGPVQRLDEKVGARFAASAGRELIDHYWGSYCAFIASGPGSHRAIRDPSGCAPLYRLQRGGATLYVPSLQAALEVGLEPMRPDPDFLRQWLSFPYLRTTRTGLAGFEEILPGTAGTFRNGRAGTDILWSPWTFAAPERQLLDFGEAAAALREELLRAVPAQARLGGRLLLELSGGLDSSIVAAALGAAGLRFASLNFATSSGEGDERRYARAAAEAARSDHIELLESDYRLDLGLPERRRFRPGVSAVMLPLHRQFAAAGERAGADTFVTGSGGDNVFCYLPTASPILDAARILGVHAALRHTLGEISELCGCTAWTTLRYALRRRLRRVPRRVAWKRESDFLAETGIAEQPEPHPWLDAPAHALAGKREHVSSLLRVQHFLDPETRMSELDFLHPLVAQPLLELCLRVPSWLWVRGGVSRAVARAAFADLLPPEILHRRGKGRLEGLCARAYVRHRANLAQLLLEGALRSEGFIDPSAVEAYLERTVEPADARYYRLFELAAAELWLRSWS